MYSAVGWLRLATFVYADTSWNERVPSFLSLSLLFFSRHPLRLQPVIFQHLCGLPVVSTSASPSFSRRWMESSLPFIDAFRRYAFIISAVTLVSSLIAAQAVWPYQAARQFVLLSHCCRAVSLLGCLVHGCGLVQPGNTCWLLQGQHPRASPHLRQGHL